MARRGAKTGGSWTYLYAFVSGSPEGNFGTIGLYDSDVYTVSNGDISAVVSDIPKTDRLRPERRHLAAHQKVLSSLTSEDGITVLPVAFGTVAGSAEDIRKMLVRYQDELQREIQRVQGKVEMELRVALEVPNVFEYFIQNHQELKDARDNIFDGKHEPTRDEKINLGQTFERVLDEDREKYTNMVEKALSEYCTQLKRNKVRNEGEVMRLSCLIEKGRKDQFESAVDEASAPFDDDFTFVYNGPFPPYNFVDLHLQP